MRYDQHVIEYHAYRLERAIASIRFKAKRARKVSALKLLASLNPFTS